MEGRVQQSQPQGAMEKSCPCASEVAGRPRTHSPLPTGGSVGTKETCSLDLGSSSGGRGGGGMVCM